ncbi:hypothetical protein N9B31_05170, partial [Mariniblastus sp.]|nr:hypothetical protein [Mariniblastus sp.]
AAAIAATLMVIAMQQLHAVAVANFSTAEFVAAFTACVLEFAACSLVADASRLAVAKQQLSLAAAKQ